MKKLLTTFCLLYVITNLCAQNYLAIKRRNSDNTIYGITGIILLQQISKNTASLEKSKILSLGNRRYVSNPIELPRNGLELYACCEKDTTSVLAMYQYKNLVDRDGEKKLELEDTIYKKDIAKIKRRLNKARKFIIKSSDYTIEWYYVDVDVCDCSYVTSTNANGIDNQKLYLHKLYLKRINKIMKLNESTKVELGNVISLNSDLFDH